MGKVSKHVRYYYISTGKGNYNAIHDKSLDEVEYPDGMMEQLSDNIIAENILSLVVSEGNNYQLLTEVTDHKKYDSAIAEVVSSIKYSSGSLHRKRATHGWKLLVEYKEGSVDWVPLKDLKHPNLVDMDEHAVANEISDRPVFNF